MTDDEVKKIRAALEALVKTTQQWCHVSVDQAGEPWLDSGALSSNAAVMRVLADHGLLTINVEVGRRVIAKWTEAVRDFGVDWDFSRFRKQAAEGKGVGVILNDNWPKDGIPRVKCPRCGWRGLPGEMMIPELTLPK
jgi:hypothetical protein